MVFPKCMLKRCKLRVNAEMEFAFTAPLRKCKHRQIIRCSCVRTQCHTKPYCNFGSYFDLSCSLTDEDKIASWRSYWTSWDGSLFSLLLVVAILSHCSVICIKFNSAWLCCITTDHCCNLPYLTENDLTGLYGKLPHTTPFYIRPNHFSFLLATVMAGSTESTSKVWLMCVCGVDFRLLIKFMVLRL